MKDFTRIKIWGENLDITFKFEKPDPTTGDNGSIDLISVIDEQDEDILSGLTEFGKEDIIDIIREDIL